VEGTTKEGRVELLQLIRAEIPRPSPAHDGRELRCRCGMGHGRATTRCRVIGFVIAAVTTSTTLVGVRILIRGGVWIVVVACVIVGVCVIVAWRRLLHHHWALILLLTL
jgi:hypothetical protein